MFLQVVEVARELLVLKCISTVKAIVAQSLYFDPQSRTALILKAPQILRYCILRLINYPLLLNEEVTLLPDIF